MFVIVEGVDAVKRKHPFFMPFCFRHPVSDGTNIASTLSTLSTMLIMRYITIKKIFYKLLQISTK